ncbi:hypothetical protein LTR91_020360 [Friedmanniomyces endolithicus]|uniref:Borealin N-terminal domain-containing protein n=1 Tax=Friedmanniomyces endolithicus TaxID=329885 RepID=A0AAN6HCM9_9PEZI|nr:hypothetical protein LTR94_014686 [Friedmanniomyces endolithicus]KAK0783979.1 hypothetical protein LTR38_012840 [Friedmanniomyces endolithicus]KAK0789292.1 hypothetical protein LTR59_009721 [Friedmanniomyces endolithicus]KAK0815588.1 hypothetical protein LTR75_003876 [Friedmanniomyces endolithicus]KAK0835318.1 hypothetical protein LTR03_014045 [Friedmanniomyces endolithicus]
MPPGRPKKTRPSTDAAASAPPPTTVPTRTDEPTQTPPERSPVADRILTAGITQAQKQALIDNLQLESKQDTSHTCTFLEHAWTDASQVTERARKLRAQYALQAQGLRTRLEMRVNRIPQALRQRKMGDLLAEHAEKARAKVTPAVPEKDPLLEQAGSLVVRSPERERKSLKRQSEYISTANNNENDDKENAPALTELESTQGQAQDLPNPKKRAKTATTTVANTKATRTVSRKGPAPPTSTILSPKSHNSRTLPRSPFKSALSPEKTALIERLASPVKQSTQQLAPPTKTVSRAPSRQAKRPGAAFGMAQETEMATEGRSSEASTASAGTTIVTTKTASKVGRLPAAQKTTVAKTAVGGRKAAAVVKKENVPPVPLPVGGGRTLRKRG